MKVSVTFPNFSKIQFTTKCHPSLFCQYDALGKVRKNSRVCIFLLKVGRGCWRNRWEKRGILKEFSKFSRQGRRRKKAFERSKYIKHYSQDPILIKPLNTNIAKLLYNYNTYVFQVAYSFLQILPIYSRFVWMQKHPVSKSQGTFCRKVARF